MASNRHLGRIVAMQTLYEYVFRLSCDDQTAHLAEILDRNINRYSETIDDKDFIVHLVNGVVESRDELDKELQPLAPEWPLDQIARIDHIVLWMGLYELIHHADVPPKVVINEAVELAKGFGSDSSSKFVNGVLGTAYRARNGEDASGKPEKPEKSE
jgi:N utilization substance protein B